MLAYTHIKDVIHLKIKLDEWYLVINYSFASYKTGLHISYLINYLEAVYFSKPFYSSFMNTTIAASVSGLSNMQFADLHDGLCAL